tara:strand:+ start:461 stop:679 length:219 start_codon:yes stop_codon:yes gene_type:complete
LSNAGFGVKKDSGANSKQNSHHNNSFAQNNNSKHRPTNSNGAIKNNQQDNPIYMDFRQMKISKIENKIFGSE